MYKFLFNLQNHTLKIAKDDHFLVLDEPFYTLGGIGFTLDHHEPPQRWIIFKVSQEKVKVVYKEAGIYYRKELVLPSSGIVEIEFTK